MATVILDTGILDLAGIDVGIAEGARTQMPLESTVYPQANDDRALISVQPGNMVVVTAYGGELAVLANVYKVLLAEPVQTKVVNTCGLEPMRVETTILADARVCDYDLVECRPMVVLDVPGVYRVAVLDPDITVTAVSHPIQRGR